jgi:hypothetical protein
MIRPYRVSLLERLRQIFKIQSNQLKYKSVSSLFGSTIDDENSEPLKVQLSQDTFNDRHQSLKKTFSELNDDQNCACE